MRTKTQPAWGVRRLRRVFQAAAFMLLLGVLGWGRVTAEAVTTSQTAANGTPQAGLVVQFGEGEPLTACVELGPDGEATGEEVLRAAGFDTVIDYTSGFGGGSVCKIGDQGCDFPAEACFCQCTLKPGDPCVYWTYFHLVDGEWRYSNISASTYTVRAGEVEGWVWAGGQAGTGEGPPLVTFEQLCAAATGAEATPAPTAQETSLAAPPVVTGTPVETSAAATASPAPSATAAAAAATEPALTATPGASPTGERQGTTPAEAGGESGNAAGYVLFGGLVVVLLGGLLLIKLRG